MLTSASLKRRIYTELRKSGFKFQRDAIIPPSLKNKPALRRVHKPALEHLLNESKSWIQENEKEQLEFFADGDEVKPEEISPRLVLIRQGEVERSNLFRYASYHWSVPLSRGFGRRLRYLVIDKSNDKLIGIIGLTDPVIGLKVRDQWVGWTKEQKERALWHTMDAYALGAVKPYSYLLGGKLVATLATSDKVRNDFRKKYSHGRSVITGRNYKNRRAQLVLVTTTGAFGKSSILDRLNTGRVTEDGLVTTRQLWQQVGFTEGWGFFHLNNGIASEIYEYLIQKSDPIVIQHKFGEGPNWKMRLIRYGMDQLGIDYEKYGRHGVKRGFYAAPLAKNYKEYLNGEVTKPKFYRQSEKQLFEFFKVRYLIPRSIRNEKWKKFDHRRLRLPKSTGSP